jgi:hypothetical protein
VPWREKNFPSLFKAYLGAAPAGLSHRCDTSGGSPAGHLAAERAVSSENRQKKAVSHR